MVSKAESKQFELLVARIEEAAAPRGALVTSPDHIRDVTSGQMREVDATIRFRVGTSDVLILIECRKRNRKEDVRWIEELATKRDSLLADKVIAVSGRAFSSPARQAARHRRIELRTLAEVSPSAIESWFLPPGGVVNVFRIIDDIECVVGFQAIGAPGGDRGYPVPATAPVFFSDCIESPFPPLAIVNIFEHSEPERFWRVPLDGTKTKLPLNLDCSKSDLEAATSAGRRKVFWVSMSVVVSYEAKKFALTEGVHHIYDNVGSHATQVSTFEGDLFGISATFEFQSTELGEITRRLSMAKDKRPV